MLKETDKQHLKAITEKYGSDCVINALLEYSYGGHTFDQHMHSAGQKGNYSGLKGLGIAIPSFLLCTMISPPLSLILLIGAVANRMTARWYEQKNAILGALNPLSWSEYIATGNYRGSGKNDLFGKKSDNTVRRSPTKDDFSDASVGNMKDAADNMYADTEKEKIKDLRFKYWFITFDNGEVLKVMANDKTAAEYFGKMTIAHPIMLNRFGKQITAYEQYRSAMSEEYKVYKAIYDDGQVLYTIGKNEQEATNTAQEMVKGYAEGFDGALEDIRSISISGVEKFKVAKVKKLEEQESLDLPLPEKIKNVSETAPFTSASSTANKEKKLRGYYWQWGEVDENGNVKKGGLHDIKTTLSQGLLVMHTPAGNSNNAEKIITTIFRNFKNTSYGKQLLSKSYESDEWYKVTFLDGDAYVIHDKSKAEAAKKVLEFYRYKIKVCKDAYSDNNRYIGIIAKRYDEVVNDFGAKNVKPVRTDEFRPKDIDIDKLKINSVLRDYDVVKDKEVNVQSIKGSRDEMVYLRNFL